MSVSKKKRLVCMKRLRNILISALLLGSTVMCGAVEFGAMYEGMDAMPQAQMGSTSAWASGSSVRAVESMHSTMSIYSAAAGVTGGVTTLDMAMAENTPRPNALRTPGVPNINPAAPIDCGWEVMAFLALLAIGYAAWRKRQTTDCAD